MRQAIHIFRKDARYCWPYIAAVVALTAVHAWQASVDTPWPEDYRLYTSDSLIALLMVLAWWLVIGAAVHGECLTGDRQFWTTRPYSWRSLLAAKLLFFAVFLALPVFISDCIILQASGFNPLDLIPGLLHRQCWLLAFLVLPFILAALTRATRELVLAILVSFLAFYTAMSVLTTPLVNPTGMVRPAPEWIGVAATWLAPALGLPLVVWQYARRRTILVLVLAVACFGLVPVVAGLWVRVHWRPYPDPKYKNVVVRLAADPGPADPVIAEGRARGLVGIPVTFNGWPRDMMIPRPMGMGAWPEPKGGAPYVSSDVSLTASSDGREWVWVPIRDLRYWPKVDMAVTVELALYDRQRRADMLSGSGWTRVPGFGNVRLLEGVGRGYPVWRTAIQPAELGWTYGLRDAQKQLASDAMWSLVMDDQPASPAWFQASPVYTYAGKFMSYVASGAAAGTNWGMPVVRHPSQESLVFTARRQVATFYPKLVIPQVRLAGYEIPR